MLPCGVEPQPGSPEEPEELKELKLCQWRARGSIDERVAGPSIEPHSFFGHVPARNSGLSTMVSNDKNESIGLNATHITVVANLAFAHRGRRGPAGSALCAWYRRSWI